VRDHEEWMLTADVTASEMSVRDQRVGTSYSDKVTEEEDDTKRKPNSKSQCRTPMGIPILMQIGRPVLDVAGGEASK